MMETNDIPKPKRVHQTCAIYNCNFTNINIKMYMFPNPKTELERFFKWLNVCKNPRFNNLPNEVIHRRGFVCQEHFKESDFVPCTNRKLYRFAVPSLYLPNNVEEFIQKDAPQSLDLLTEEQDKSITDVEPHYDIPFKDLPYLQLDTNVERVGMKTVSEALDSLLDPTHCKPIKLKRNKRKPKVTLSDVQDEPLAFPNNFEALPTVQCRICLAFTIQAISLLENPQIAEMLESLISIKISNTELLPTICVKCFLNLKLANSIQLKMLKAEQNLQEQFKLMESSEVIKENENLEVVQQDLNIEEILDTNQQTSIIHIRENSILKQILVKPKVRRKKKVNLKKVDSNLEKKAEPCPLCKKKYKNLENHLKGHNERKSLCEYCGISMSALSLSIHKVNKHKIYSFKCNFCDKIFTKRYKKEVHEARDHNGKPGHMCDICGKRFYLAKYLKLHVIYVHNKRRPFACEICNCSYRSSHALMIHQRTHTKITPYQCKICDKQFAVKWRLRNHLLKIHQLIPNLQWECRECNKKFATESSLTLHFRIHY